MIVFGLAVWGFGFAAYMVYAASGAAKPRKAYDTEGTLLRPPKGVDVMFGVPTTAIVCAAVLYLVLAPFGMVDYVPTGVMRVTVPSGCGFMVAFGAPTLFRMFKHGGMGHLRLSPSGFEVWNGQWGSFVRGSWDEVEQVLDHPLRGRKPFHDVIVFALPKGRSAMLVADAITGDTQTLMEWVRFYWQHPEYRDELTDARGLRRLDDAKPSSE